MDLLLSSDIHHETSIFRLRYSQILYHWLFVSLLCSLYGYSIWCTVGFLLSIRIVIQSWQFLYVFILHGKRPVLLQADKRWRFFKHLARLLHEQNERYTRGKASSVVTTFSFWTSLCLLSVFSITTPKRIASSAQISFLTKNNRIRTIKGSLI
jgi:hypothetical protein